MDNLNTEYIGKNILIYDVLDSTNTTAKEKITSPEGTVILAKKQLKGRGRGDRKWHSDNSGGLYFSVILKPSIPAEEISQITLLAGFAVSVAIEKASGIVADIKWPNDVLINKRKVSGILSEFISKNEETAIILGIGINVGGKEFPIEISNIATSVEKEAGVKIPKEDILKLVLEEFEKVYEIFLKDGFLPLKEAYEKRCITINKEVKIITPKGEYFAHSKGISSTGELIIEKDGEVKNVSSGEVSVRGIY